MDLSCGGENYTLILKPFSPRMGHTFFPAAPLLQPYIEHIVVADFDFSIKTQICPVYTFVPGHLGYLCFTLADSFQVIEKNQQLITRPDALIIGMHLKPTTVNLGKRHRAVYIGYKPWGLHKLLALPQTELLHQCEDARTFLGSEIDELTDRMRAANTDIEINVIVQNYLLKKHQHHRTLKPLEAAIEHLILTKGNKSVEDIASLACLSLRQLEREFKLRVGLSPKLYSRLVRFSSVMKYKEIKPNVSWGEMALHHGYFDHMHLIRDFKTFTGTTPTAINSSHISFPAPF